MRVLLGIQATGNGHISRCHALADAFQQVGIEADYLVSGRPREALFDMQRFAGFQYRHGLSFQVQQGRVSLTQTLRQNPWRQFWQDVNRLDLDAYDAILTDFEPVTAWAAKRQGRAAIGIGRQYAFFNDIAGVNMGPLQKLITRRFAPSAKALGMHWTAANEHVLPPIIHHRQLASSSAANNSHYLVYLPFESLTAIQQLLQAFPLQRFHVFHPAAKRCSDGHIEYFPPSRQGFAEHFAGARGIIANAGFETSCEALASGKRLLVRPLAGQFEQQVNAQLLQRYGFAEVMPQLSQQALAQWLVASNSIRISWPNVALAVAEWLLAGQRQSVAQLASELWGKMEQQAIAA
ncbi:glycosyltransferase family protein [Idiomarina xiamenensis]|uniref:Glycosyl transferase n=1 Tax=Idiomarina xiamenensis 10-D-4 TaxID=740709 RepID=K2KQW7_9GAMM|nr:glycosyltransferase family protein [Idiomarina xiamenensis]EKE79900.1 glycosyl transferase [Idiomarina xiamenensis 10-D-4]